MSKAKLRFLGTGTSQGVPMIGCGCEVCRSADSRDKRLRASVLVEYEGLTILVDAGPDFRQQMLAAGVSHLDAILLTHNHKDHTGGLDDIRAFNYLEKMQDRIIKFVVGHSSIKEDFMRRIIARTDMLVGDIGSVLDGYEAVECGLIDEVGGIKEAIAYLRREKEISDNKIKAEKCINSDG